jgi:hypothetical protein
MGISSPGTLRFLGSVGIGVKLDLVFREKGRDLVSFWLSFLRLFSIAFFTARLPPSAAIASYRALRSSFFFSAIRKNDTLSVVVMEEKEGKKAHHSLTNMLFCPFVASPALPLL